jgi:hypothetical protein
MKKIYVQRKIEVWVEDVYEVDEINDEIIDRALDYDLDVDTSEVLWETQIDLGPVEVYDEQRKLIYSQKYNE